jgi:hypothetical protein
MEIESALGELEALAAKLGVQIVYDHLTGDGMGQGGLCKVKGQWRVIVERRSPPSEKLSIIAQALARFDLEAHFLSPDVRALVERYRPPAPPAAPPAGDG